MAYEVWGRPLKRALRRERMLSVPCPQLGPYLQIELCNDASRIVKKLTFFLSSNLMLSMWQIIEQSAIFYLKPYLRR